MWSFAAEDSTIDSLSKKKIFFFGILIFLQHFQPHYLSPAILQLPGRSPSQRYNISIFIFLPSSLFSSLLQTHPTLKVPHKLLPIFRHPNFSGCPQVLVLIWCQFSCTKLLSFSKLGICWHTFFLGSCVCTSGIPVLTCLSA